MEIIPRHLNLNRTNSILQICYISVCTPSLMMDDTLTDCYIYGCTRTESEEDEFKPKYKYFENIRDLRRDKDLIVKFRYSPSLKRKNKEKEKSKQELARPTVKLKSEDITSSSLA